MSAVDYILPRVSVLCMYTTISATVISVIYSITHKQGFVRTALHAKWCLLNYVKTLTKLNEGSVHNQNTVTKSCTRIANLRFMSWIEKMQDDVRLLQRFKPQRNWQILNKKESFSLFFTFHNIPLGSGGTPGNSDHYTFLGNCPPTPLLSQHFVLSEKWVFEVTPGNRTRNLPHRRPRTNRLH